MERITTEYLLDVIKKTATTRFSLEYLQDFNIRTYVDHQLQELFVTIEKPIIGKTQVKTYRYKTFNSWKDHFKHDNKDKKWMKWWIKKHPIQSKSHVIECSKHTVFPEFKLPKDMQGLKEVVFYELRKKY